ncbi:hypothetical protein BY458DRAFT_445771 [Sporodiniella umbellata]|nr:hypothetical protein BY458DRAFT_445771 [Sporodiniella umbellata]
MASTFSTLLIYVEDILSGTRRNINTKNVNFLARIGNSRESIELLQVVGFILENELLIPPEANTRLREIRDEVLLILSELRYQLGVAAVPISATEKEIEIGFAYTSPIFGIVSTLEQPKTSTNEYLEKAYKYFGLTFGASDHLVSWTYQKVTGETKLDMKQAIDYLTRIANITNSEILQTLTVCEKSTGKLGYSDIGDAYAYFSLSPDANVDDKLLIGLYQLKLSDDPAEKIVHQDKLKAIAIARNSPELVDFLKSEKGIISSMSMESVQQLMGVPSHMLTVSRVPGPVGLNNIGNTCYFNSLLQYYFTLLPFRLTMVNNELFVEDENSDFKKIGGIKVDQSEIRRAKKFVELLKALFVNLQNTKEKAISPEYDLAYMALLNEKDQSEEEDNKTLQDSEDMDCRMEESTVELSDIPSEAPPSYEDTINDVEVTQKKPPSKTKERPSVDAMMFGKQQDVTECMGNVMYLVEAALKPLSKTEDGEQIDDMIRQVFYGKARQIISYCDNTTLKTIKKEMEEDFSHVIVDASEGKDLYDGLDEYFFENQLENFQGGHEAVREVTVKSFPPVLQVLVQRVQFDRATVNIYKSNAYVQFDKTIYLDRYLDENFESLKDKRLETKKWKSEYQSYKKQLSKYRNSQNSKLPVVDVLEATYKIIHEFKEGRTDEEQAKVESALRRLEKEIVDTKNAIEAGTEKMKEIKSKIRHQYDDQKRLAYKLHAVFIHQGQASYGHYWVYILDHKENQWWKYNDSLITKVEESEILHDTTGSTANPYFLVYIDADKVDSLVQTIIKA